MKFEEPKAAVRGSSLFRRFFFIAASIVLVSLIIVGGALLLLVTKYWMDEKTDLLKTNAVSVADNTADVLSNYMGESSRGSIIVICNNLNQISSAIEADIFIANTGGNVVYCKEILQTGLSLGMDPCIVHSNYHISAETMQMAMQGVRAGTGYLDGCLSDLSFVVSSPVIVNGRTVAVVFVSQSISNGLAPYVLAIFRMFFLAALFGLIISGFASYFIAAKTTRPLRLMAAAAQKYAEGDFSYRIPEKKGRLRRGNNEFHNLVTAFNSMAQALEALENSRRSFVGNVSHELKTPMTTIKGFIDGILDGTIAEDKRDQYLNIVSDEVGRLSSLVVGMLNMSRIESGEATLNPSDFDISEMIVKILIGFEQVIENKSIEILGLDDIEANPVFADYDMIYQAVFNLIDNAVKYTPEGGSIEISSKNDSEKIIVRISNSGKGIEPEEIGRIFERFYKVDKSRSFDAKSAGIGLYLVKLFIEFHGGSIKASSVPGERTDFIFWLPKS